MKSVCTAVKVTDTVYWVGAIDWHIRDMHGYLTNSGTTYNAYLVLDDKVTLIDTVKAPFKNEMLSRISSLIDPEKIDYIVSNHAEMDHSGALPEIVSAARPAKVVASRQGVKALADHLHWDCEVQAVKDGEKMSLGNAGYQVGSLVPDEGVTDSLHGVTIRGEFEFEPAGIYTVDCGLACLNCAELGKVLTLIFHHLSEVDFELGFTVEVLKVDSHVF